MYTSGLILLILGVAWWISGAVVKFATAADDCKQASRDEWKKELGVLIVYSAPTGDGRAVVRICHERDNERHQFADQILPAEVWQDYIGVLQRGGVPGHLYVELRGVEETANELEAHHG